MKLNIAEEFHSQQGEGNFVGTCMHFIRLAGCSVGHPLANVGPFLSTGRLAWQCQTYANKSFWCDTDFNKKFEMTVEEIIKSTPEYHICLTGGEPLMLANMAAVVELARACKDEGKQLHIETSGTCDVTPLLEPGRYLEMFLPGHIWLTVAPKLGWRKDVISVADELKLLVDLDFDPDSIPSEFKLHPLVYLSPINDEKEIRRDTLQVALECLKKFPMWRLSVQMHKFIGVR